MAGVGLLRPCLQRALRISLKQQWTKSGLCLPAAYVQPDIRNMASHGPRKMVLTPSRFDWESFKDDINRYLWLGLLPMGLLIFYANMFVGQAELRDIPEDYEPEYWEYYKGPIQRTFSKYVYGNPEDEYEKNLQMIHNENEKIKMKKLSERVQAVMSDRLDYKGWYYVAVEKNRIDLGKEAINNAMFGIGFKTEEHDKK